MSYSSNGYSTRAEECVRLANMTADPMLGAELLTLRQSYLTIADRLRKIEATGSKASRVRTP